MPQKEGLGVQTMAKYDGTLPKVIASHVRSLPLKVLKEGVWEDMRMLNDKTWYVHARLPQTSQPPYVTVRLLHRRALRQAPRRGLPFKKVGVWEDTRMLTFT